MGVMFRAAHILAVVCIYEYTVYNDFELTLISIFSLFQNTRLALTPPDTEEKKQPFFVMTETVTFFFIIICW